MAALTTVEQYLTAKRSLLIQQEECQTDMKYHCKQCDFKTTRRGNLITHQAM